MSTWVICFTENTLQPTPPAVPTIHDLNKKAGPSKNILERPTKVDYSEFGIAVIWN
jgi:hypothetical protein